LRALPKPFAVVSMVGPTRTGKSSVLGRAFLGRPDMFEIGTGVHSHTAGIWITSKPIMMDIPGRGKMPTIMIDTEGFHGVQQLTSQTYESNLFALTHLLSSTMVFNTMYPADAADISELKGYSSMAFAMQQSLLAQGMPVQKPHPSLFWVVQNFNFVNLLNSNFTAEGLFDSLVNGTTKQGAEDHDLANLKTMFRSRAMVPMHKPHFKDDLLSNLGTVPDKELFPEYIQDLDSFQGLVASQLRPMQIDGRDIDGNEFADNIARWILYGHIHIEEDDRNRRFVDQYMQRFIEATMAQFEAKVRAENMGAFKIFKESLEAFSANATSTVELRATFWKFAWKDSGEYAKMILKIQQSVKEADERYKVAALEAMAQSVPQREKSIQGSVDQLETTVSQKAFQESIAKIREHAKSSLSVDLVHYGLVEAEPVVQKINKSIEAMLKAAEQSYLADATKHFEKFAMETIQACKERVNQLDIAVALPVFKESLGSVIKASQDQIQKEIAHYGLLDSQAAAAKALAELEESRTKALARYDIEALAAIRKKFGHISDKLDTLLKQVPVTGTFSEFEQSVKKVIDTTEKQLTEEIQQLGVSGVAGVTDLLNGVTSAVAKAALKPRSLFLERVSEHMGEVETIAAQQVAERLEVMRVEALYAQKSVFETEAGLIVEDARKAVTLEVARLGLDTLPTFDKAAVEARLTTRLQKLVTKASAKFVEDKDKAQVLEAVAGVAVSLLALWLLYRCCCSRGHTKDSTD